MTEVSSALILTVIRLSCSRHGVVPPTGTTTGHRSVTGADITHPRRSADIDSACVDRPAFPDSPDTATCRTCRQANRPHGASHIATTGDTPATRRGGHPCGTRPSITDLVSWLSQVEPPRPDTAEKHTPAPARHGQRRPLSILRVTDPNRVGSTDSNLDAILLRIAAIAGFMPSLACVHRPDCPSHRRRVHRLQLPASHPVCDTTGHREHAAGSGHAQALLNDVE